MFRGLRKFAAVGLLCWAVPLTLNSVASFIAAYILAVIAGVAAGVLLVD